MTLDMRPSTCDPRPSTCNPRHATIDLRLLTLDLLPSTLDNYPKRLAPMLRDRKRPLGPVVRKVNSAISQTFQTCSATGKTHIKAQYFRICANCHGSTVSITDFYGTSGKVPGSLVSHRFSQFKNVFTDFHRHKLIIIATSVVHYNKRT